MKTLDAAAPAGRDQSPSHWWLRVEAALDRISERFNPILIKESRQALKSRQFLTTFTLLLLAGWGWTLIGVAMLTPDVYYAPGGAFMLAGYYFVIGVPLLIVAPFSTFRSLGAEREDGTFELVSITNLSAWQIVTGKLGSALMQMLVYYSALSPCIGFTYLLRGVDMLTIFFVLLGTFVVSMMLSGICLLLATITSDRYWQALLSVLILLGLLFAGFMWSMFIVAWLGEGSAPPYDQAEFWLAMGTIATFYLSYLLLMMLATAAQLSFSTDNRSTKLRVVLFATQIFWTAWMFFYWSAYGDEEFLYVYCSMAGIQWALAGGLLTGESSELSPRVRRGLPQSLIGRTLFTWFNPGSGTGYMFVVGNLASVVLLTVAAGAYAEFFLAGSSVDLLNLIFFGVLTLCYVTMYLGAVRLVTMFIGRYYSFGLSLPFLLNVLTALAGCAIPFFGQMAATGFIEPSYSEYQFMNWLWTLVQCVEGGMTAYPSVVLIVMAGATGVFLVNLPFAAREALTTHEATPERVRQDEREQHEDDLYQQYQPTSPWDEAPEDRWMINNSANPSGS